MIARIWHGVVPVSKGDEYLDRMRRIALPEYRATRGNRGGWCLYRTQGDGTHFQMLTFWDDANAIKRFAGDDYSMAKYYDFDPEYLIEMEPRVQHYKVYSDRSSDPFKSTRGRGAAKMIARVWRGVVPIEKAEAYSRYLADFGFRDYQAYFGNRGVHLLRSFAGYATAQERKNDSGSIGQAHKAIHPPVDKMPVRDTGCLLYPAARATIIAVPRCGNECIFSTACSPPSESCFCCRISLFAAWVAENIFTT